MPRTVLLASRDASLVATRCSVMLAAGYEATCVLDLASALKQAAELRPDLIIIGHSFSVQEQTEFIEQLQEVLVSVSVICLRPGVVHPRDLLHECKSLLESPSRSIRTRIVHGSDTESMDGLGSPFSQTFRKKLERAYLRTP